MRIRAVPLMPRPEAMDCSSGRSIVERPPDLRGFLASVGALSAPEVESTTVVVVSLTQCPIERG